MRETRRDWSVDFERRASGTSRDFLLQSPGLYKFAQSRWGSRRQSIYAPGIARVRTHTVAPVQKLWVVSRSASVKCVSSLLMAK